MPTALATLARAPATEVAGYSQWSLRDRLSPRHGVVISKLEGKPTYSVNTLYVKDRRAWRAWLRKHGATCQEIWLVYYKKGSGKPRVPYDHAVEEALCYGWIDGQIRALDEHRYLQRFTPRRPGSEWAPSNLKRMKRLIAEGRVTRAGLKAFNVPRKVTPPLPTQMPRNLEKIFKAQAEAWHNYQSFPPYYRRMTTGWVASAKKEETRRKRLEKLMAYSARNERIKFM